MTGRVLFLVFSLLLQAAIGFSASPTRSTQDQAELAAGSNAFATKLYGQFRQQKGNLFFSPASIWTAFGMAYAGAGGGTAAEMKAALDFTSPPDRLHPAIGAFLDQLNNHRPGCKLRVADALWVDQSSQILPGFLRLTEADYGAGLHRVNIGNAPDPRLTINRWVEAQTENRIKDLLPPGSVDSGTRLILTNAVYFRGEWESEFEKAETREELFHLSPSQDVRAPLMHKEGSFRYLNGGTFQVLEVPYRGEMSLLVFLPNDPGGLSAFEDRLTPAQLNESLARLHYDSRVILTLPKFKATQEFSLIRALIALGVKQAFDSKTADFSAMTRQRDLWISSAFHKAYIDVDEEGTEAAAATSIALHARSMPGVPKPPIVFRADHPFLYLIRDDQSGCILFMGRVADPTT